MNNKIIFEITKGVIKDGVAKNKKDIENQNKMMESLFQPNKKSKFVSKSITIRQDQVDKIEIYSQIAGKNDSEFIRDALDYLFEVIEDSSLIS